MALFFAALTPGFGQPKPTATPVAPRPLPTAPIQNVVPPAPVNPPASADQAPAAVPPAQTTIAPPPSVPGSTPLPDRTVTLQYPNSDVVDVLHLYETLTGKKLIMDNFVQGKVSIFLSRPVPREEAIKIIEINLLMNGYSLVPADGDIVKVIGANKSPRNAGVAIISDEADIPAGEQVVSFLFKLNYADPIELQQVLSQYLQPPQSYTSFLALPKSGSVLITENSAVIRRLVRIIDQVDVPPAQVVSEFIKLQRADASKVVEMLKEVFDKGGTTTTTTVATNVQPGVRPVRRTQCGPAGAAGAGGRGPERVHRALGRFDRRRQNQDRRRCPDEPDSRHYAPGQHAVHQKADRGVRRERRVWQAGYASVALHQRGRCPAGFGAGADRARHRPGCGTGCDQQPRRAAATSPAKPAAHDELNRF